MVKFRTLLVDDGLVDILPSPLPSGFSRKGVLVNSLRPQGKQIICTEIATIRLADVAFFNGGANEVQIANADAGLL